MPPRITSVLSGVKIPKASWVLWQGPEAEGPLGGVTFSMLSRFLSCRERFRVRYLEGWQPTDQFNHRIEYGNMWHACEEAAAKEVLWSGGNLRGIDTTAWEDALKAYCQGLCRKYPLAQEQINHWYRVCGAQFPVYVDYWSRHEDVQNRSPLLQEQVFDVPYELSSGRTVRLRGKWDSVDLVKTGKVSRVWLQENKTKGDIDEQAIQRQTSYDLQSMLYLVALGEQFDNQGHGDGLLTPVCRDVGSSKVIAGVRYNVVRRPLSGGEGTIMQREPTKGAKCPKCNTAGTVDGTICLKCEGAGRVGARPGETDDEFYARVRGVIDGTGVKTTGGPYTGPSHWFMRWNIEVSPADVAAFRHDCLDPILEQLCWWYDSVTGVAAASKMDWEALCRSLNYRHPFGVANTIDEYGWGDLDEFLATGNTVGLRRVEKLFRELEPVPCP